MRILAEVAEFGNKEDAAYYAKWAPRAPLATASLRTKTKLVCYKEVDSDEDLGKEDDEFEEEEEPAPKKKKKKATRPPTGSWRVRLANALDLHGGVDLARACLGKNDPRWNETLPLAVRDVPFRTGYPAGTEKTSTGRSMFRDTEPSAEGVYEFHKIVYEPGTKGKHTKKSGEKVYYRKVKESDVPAIKEKFPHLVF